MVISSNSRKNWLWRAVDENGYVLDALVQHHRDKRASSQAYANALEVAGLRAARHGDGQAVPLRCREARDYARC